ncbi:MAG: AraC family transcriptional regulator [Clostridia bacterium]|nr:AraC family transcriptional regulator [Clostridia bacterium]
MYPERLKLSERHPHWRVEDIFRTGRAAVRGFVQRDYSIGMHEQEFYEINIILRGCGMHYIGGRRTSAEVGDVFILPPHIMHGYAGGEGFDVYHILLSPAFFERNLPELQTLPAFSALFRAEPFMREKTAAKLYLHLSQRELEGLSPRLSALTAYSDTDRAADAIIANCNAMMLIADLCSAYGDAASDESDGAFMRSVTYIYDNYREKLGVGDLARLAQTSRTAYIARFRETMGATPGEFILSYRLSLARNMLTETALPVAEIAQSSGFYDASHLTRAFIKKEGLSPAEYRKKSRE